MRKSPSVLARPLAIAVSSLLLSTAALADITFDYYKGQLVGITATAEIDQKAFGVGPFSTGPIAITINSEMKAK